MKRSIATGISQCDAADFAAPAPRFPGPAPRRRRGHCAAKSSGVEDAAMRGFVYFDIQDRARLPSRFFGVARSAVGRL